ncbi:hypothetical protein ACOT81_27410 [Streptomyces sp. WI04-05B]|uniref:hypothetical protein n=1 Tax=Streptomyces TaxID=1883 RepID=UPI0029BD2CAA|nr:MULTISPECIES: hypothetical protein [unclassified Streptomyces]MDX2546158.1 hypothetical protein [Streptomyces sp. WI04-05B]MDX2587152.1 hypothetical protein [Streptomyces sp. WI04-05A]MDX3750689.1 hypothetical protein [Streptomyces sp. AK08-02]
MTIPGSPHPNTLPTERLTPRRQLGVVDGIADLGGPECRPVTARDLAARLGITPKTISRATGFLTHTGILHPGRGAWALTELGYSLARLRSTDSARARLLLRDHWQDSWFQQHAQRWLASGPLEEAELAAHLSVDQPGPPERGLYLTEWMTYALLIERDEQGRLALPAEQQAATAPGSGPSGPMGVLDPLMNTSAEQLSALPDAEFIALMSAYTTVFASLTPKIPRPRS